MPHFLRLGGRVVGKVEWAVWKTRTIYLSQEPEHKAFHLQYRKACSFAKSQGSGSPAVLSSAPELFSVPQLGLCPPKADWEATDTLPPCQSVAVPEPGRSLELSCWTTWLKLLGRNCASALWPWYFNDTQCCVVSILMSMFLYWKIVSTHRRGGCIF